MQAATVQVSNRALETALEGDDVRSAAVWEFNIHG